MPRLRQPRSRCSMPAADSSRFFCRAARRLASSSCFSLALRLAFFPLQVQLVRFHGF